MILVYKFDTFEFLWGLGSVFISKWREQFFLDQELGEGSKIQIFTPPAGAAVEWAV